MTDREANHCQILVSKYQPKKGKFLPSGYQAPACEDRQEVALERGLKRVIHC